MLESLQGKKILLGITASIAIIKVDTLIALLESSGAEVKIIITENTKKLADQLIAEKRLEKSPDFINGSYQDMFTPVLMKDIEHVALAQWADIVLITPATANIIAKLTYGLADNLLLTVCLATKVPIAIAPAMNDGMWLNSITQQNVKNLIDRGVKIFGPGIGKLACGDIGPGRMLEPEELVEMTANIFLPQLLKGKKVVVTAGPTEEPIDPVRVISNYSSGKMGYAMAKSAEAFGAEVILISGPTKLTTPKNIDRIDVQTTQEMYDVVMSNIDGCDIFVATAAVADYRPKKVSKQKIKKEEADELIILLTKNPDILSGVAALETPPLTVGFAAETNDIEIKAKRKLEHKSIDIIAANLVGKGVGFNSDQNELTVFTRTGGTHHLQLQDKDLLAVNLMRIVIDFL